MMQPPGSKSLIICVCSLAALGGGMTLVSGGPHGDSIPLALLQGAEKGKPEPMRKTREERILALMEKNRQVKSPEQNVAAIKKALDVESSMEFSADPLDKVVEYLQDYHEIPIQLDRKALEDAKIDPTGWVTMKQQKVSLRAGLRLITEPRKLKFIIKDEVLLITTKARADAEVNTRPYPVHDMLDRDKEVKLGELMDTIRSTIAPSTWAPAGRGQIKPLGKSLVILQTDEVHDDIAQLLETLRAEKGKK